MNNAYFRRGLYTLTAILACACFFVLYPYYTNALNINSYSDTITDSAPLAYANHTLDFTLLTDVAPGGFIEIEPPLGFELSATTSIFAERNIQVSVNGTPRSAGASLTPTQDQVLITRGSPGLIRYNLNSSTGIASGSNIQIRIGNHTTTALLPGFEFSSSTGTTTVEGDVEPVRNSAEIGTHKVGVTIGGGTEEAYAGFSIAVINNMSIAGVDTTEEIPPFRFNGAPTGELGGTTPGVELSLETDELSICRFSRTAGTLYENMEGRFDMTGTIIHTVGVSVIMNALNTYYIRCVDDEGNINVDDFVIEFLSLPPPTGDPNEEGENNGDGSGTGNSGGQGSSGGGTSSGSGSSGSGGNSSGGGGSGGGSGGDTGEDEDGEAGGGFENANAPYQSGDAEVIIRGYGFPGRTVYALVDGYQSDSVRAGNDGSYSITIDAIARGVYTFGVYSIDGAGTKSSTFSTSFTVTGGRTSNLSNINIMPSIKVSPNPVTPGQSLAVSGQAIPNAEITIENQNTKSTASKKTFTTTSNGSGEWSTTIDTTGFTNGTYKIRAQAIQKSGLNLSTNFSDYTNYGVGQNADVPSSADLNTDGKINLTDFSILLFWWGSDAGDSNPSADINGDKKVNLTDFSILLFNWTG